MGKLSGSKVAIVVVLTAITSVLIYRQPARDVASRAVRLGPAFRELGSWNEVGEIVLDEAVVRALALDDYLFKNFSNGKQTVTLYVGYYLSADKVGASHDPLVCFPGQGWVVSDREKGVLPLGRDSGPTISYSSMLARQGDKTELVIYWFQSHDKTAPDTFSQKMQSLLNRLKNEPDDNAFVRITVPASSATRAECLNVGHDFMRAFYPRYLEIVRGASRQ